MKGAFSPHFESENVLVREALARALGDQQLCLEEDQLKSLDLEGAIRRYLNTTFSKTLRMGVPPRRYFRGSPLSPGPPGLRASAARQHAGDIFGLMVPPACAGRAPSIAEAQLILDGGVEAALPWREPQHRKDGEIQVGHACEPKLLVFTCSPKLKPNGI
ncbi:TetR/AcrR family transcriptional repressor of nem operon [Bradyrhizobium elkanii]|nr:hypothetical protein [Bradyrhizobium elkanii]